MASIRKSGKKWQAIIRMQGYATVSKLFTTKSNAERWARQQEVEIETKGLITDFTAVKTTTVAQLLSRYEAQITPTKRGAKVERNVIATLKQAGFASLPLQQLTTKELLAYRNKRLKSVSTSTFKRQINVLQHAITIAITEWGFPLASNPVAALPRMKMPKGRSRRVTISELTKLYGNVSKKAPRLCHLISFAIETGMRRGEIVALDWKHVDLDRKTALLPLTKNGEARQVPLSTAALTTLAAIDRKPAGSVFDYTDNSLNLAWQRLVRKSGLDDLHFHDFRHEAISRFFERGLSMPEVALISGHKDFSMLARYTHLRAEEVANKLA